MTGAFWYLTTHTLRNRVMVMLRRIKQPRYAVGMLFIVAYFGFLAWGQATGFGGKSRPSMLQNDAIRTLAPALLALVMLTNWFGDSALSALAFSAPEIAMLFPAPVSRRSLILLKLARAQLPLLFNVLIIMLLWGGGRSVGIPRALSAVGLYTMFSTLYLHKIGAALVSVSTVKHGRSAAKRNWMAYVTIGIMAAAMFVVMIESGPAGRDGDSAFSDIIARASAALSVPWIHFVLTPFRLIAAPAFARTTAEWFMGFSGAATVLALHLVWVLRSHASFEEAAAEQSERLRAMAESIRKRGTTTIEKTPPKGRTTLPLRPLGHPAVAIVWRNSLAFIRTVRAFTWILVFAAPVIVGALLNDKGEKAFVGVAMVAAVLAVLLLFAGGLIARNDLRGDLLNLAALKTMPLHSSTIVFAEVTSSALPLSIVQSLLLWMAVGSVQLSNKPVAASVALALIVTVPVGVVGLNILTSTIRNGAAMLFPAWTKLGVDGTGGIEVMGQAMLSLMATTIAFIVLLVVPALLTLVIVSVIHPPAVVAVVSAIVLGSAATIGESYLVMLWIGRVLERTEPSASLTAA